MTDKIATLSATAILAIPANQPELLFTGSADSAKKEYRKLASIWHPDRCKDAQANAVFAWLKDLYQVAEAKLASGAWEVPGLLRVTSTAGTSYEIRYLRKMKVDMGQMYVGNSVLVFDIAAENEDLVAQALATLSGFTYASASMEAEFSRYFPELQQRIETPTGAVLIFKKTPDLLLLQDVLDHFKGEMPARHVAWVISRLLNIACYLERQGKVAHNAIALDSVFISPKFHSAALLGGWWFSARLGAPLKAATRRMTLFAPPDVMQRKVADSRTDLELIKALGRELLGDVTGVRLFKNSAVPSALANWLQMSSAQDAVGGFKEWQERVLIDAFGQREFVELALTQQELYKTI